MPIGTSSSFQDGSRQRPSLGGISGMPQMPGSFNPTTQPSAYAPPSFTPEPPRLPPPNFAPPSPLTLGGGIPRRG
jgi:hypothetical protein